MQILSYSLISVHVHTIAYTAHLCSFILHWNMMTLGHKRRLVWWSERCLCCSSNCICYRCATM